MIAALKNIVHKCVNPIIEKGSVEAYNLWAENYDNQPGNLMLDMDEAVFAELLSGVIITDKRVADIGCGTGRHWPKLLMQQPAYLTGFDVSDGMLDKLKLKYPVGHTYQIYDNLFTDMADKYFDVIISTLTVAHIEDLDEALQSWSRILKPYSDIIITDFHPNALAFGGKRTFEHHKTQIAVQNYVHYVSDIEDILLQNDFHVVNKVERRVDESVKRYYVAKNALHVYEKFKDSRIIYGIHLRRGYGTE